MDYYVALISDIWASLYLSIKGKHLQDISSSNDNFQEKFLKITYASDISIIFIFSNNFKYIYIYIFGTMLFISLNLCETSLITG